MILNIDESQMDVALILQQTVPNLSTGNLQQLAYTVETCLSGYHSTRNSIIRISVQTVVDLTVNN